jgi:hypothetical protein
MADWVRGGGRDSTPVAKICARVDYLDRLQEQFPSSQQVRAEFKALVEECRAALKDAEEND